MKTLFLMLLLAVSVAGCGSKSSSPNTSAADGLMEFPDIEGLKKVWDAQYVVCGEDGLDCPGFATKLAFWGQSSADSYYLGVCSGTLYKNKYIITNSHCIPDDIKRAGANCRNHIKALYPKTKYYNEEAAGCLRIIQAFDQEAANPDIAIIELDRVVIRDSVNVSNEGFLENTAVHAYTMNPSEFSNSLGTIVKKTCTLTTDNAYTLSNKATSANGVIYGNNCNVIHGNSGSGLLNAKGELVGAVFAMIELDGLRKFYRDNNVNYLGSEPTGVAQNITCLNNLTTNSGVKCSMANPTKYDLSEFVKRAIYSNGLTLMDSKSIEYTMKPGFKLELKYLTKGEKAVNSIDAFEILWNKIFVSGSAAAQFSMFKTLQRY